MRALAIKRIKRNYSTKATDKLWLFIATYKYIQNVVTLKILKIRKGTYIWKGLFCQDFSRKWHEKNKCCGCKRLTKLISENTLYSKSANFLPKVGKVHTTVLVPGPAHCWTAGANLCSVTFQTYQRKLSGIEKKQENPPNK